MAVCTAETIQNGLECQRITAPALGPTQCLQSLRIHLKGGWGVKLGLCALEPSELRELVTAVQGARPTACIWDPIQAPTAGVGLHGAAELMRMAEIILPSGEWVVAPNRLEAAALAGQRPETDPEILAKTWLGLGARAVWLKGGHAPDERIEDLWIDDAGVRSLGKQPRLPGDRRGTGCTLASAWLGFRLQGEAEVPAAEKAGAWLRTHWQDATQPGGVGRPSFTPVRG